jgi:N-acetyl-D-muramate 6-phosphate phosphatase
MSPRPGIRAVLFDLDGTLIDTAPDMIAALDRLLAENGRPALPFDVARTQVSHGSGGLVRLGFPDLAATPRFEELRQRYLAIYFEAVVRDTRLFDGFDAVLGAIESRGAPWGIVTNKPEFLTTPLLKALALDGRAGCVVSGDTLPQRKPHPAPLLHAAAALRVEPGACVYVGDAERDVQAARAAGMPVLLASYGYLGPDDDTAAWAADAALAAPGDLLDWLGWQ